MSQAGDNQTTTSGSYTSSSATSSKKQNAWWSYSKDLWDKYQKVLLETLKDDSPWGYSGEPTKELENAIQVANTHCKEDYIEIHLNDDLEILEVMLRKRWIKTPPLH